MGETVYAFLPRTVVGSLKNAWRLEQPRFKRRDESHWSIRNDVLNAWLMSVVLWAALLVVFGIGILPYLLLQAAVGIVLLEIVNYLEHYGMLRQKEHTGINLRTGARQPQLEQQQHRHERAALPLAAPTATITRTPPALLTPARRPMRRRYCRLGYAGMILLALFPALVVQSHGPAGARPLRRRHHPPTSSHHGGSTYWRSSPEFGVRLK